MPGGGMDSRSNFRSPNCKATLRDVNQLFQTPEWQWPC
ncbi:hypothetical protein SynMINOS11_02353 [Synechococcus sp. Minos11]|nr:hypothetical protein SynMINOS11_02353 [Synechococcus sp. Minos11]